MVKICVLDGYTLNPGDNPWTAIEELGEVVVYEKTSSDQIVDRAKDADIVLTNKTPLTAETLSNLPNLKHVSVLATGYNVVDVTAATACDIVVSNVPEYSTRSVAQFAFALILDRFHQVGRHNDAVKQGRWQTAGHFCFWDTPQMELVDKTLGIVGFGRIGRSVARLATAFGMNVCVHTRTSGREEPGVTVTWVSMDELIAQADVISLHCPLTAENEGMVDAYLLAKMKRTAILVNTSRGPLVNEDALADALNDGVIAGAACDVTEVEPIASTSPLLTARNMTITPHIAWATFEARQRLMQTTADNVQAFLKGSPIHVVN